MLSSPLCLCLRQGETKGIGRGNCCRKLTFCICPCRCLSQWDCVMELSLCKGSPNATGVSCPQVHYSHWHWANWLMWLCSSGGMTLKWGWGKQEQCPQRLVVVSDGERSQWKRRSQRWNLKAQHWHISGYLSDGFGCVVHLARPLWIMLIRFPGSQIFKVTRWPAWCELNG